MSYASSVKKHLRDWVKFKVLVAFFVAIPQNR